MNSLTTMSTFIALIRGQLFRLICRLFRKNIAIGKDLRLYCRLSIKGKGRVSIGDHCIIRGIPGSPTQYVTLWTTAPEATLSIGNSVQLNATKISCRFLISIGDNVIIEDASIMDTDFHSLDISRCSPPNESKGKCAIRIGNNVGISSRSIITKGVTLGDGCLVAPSSLVQHSFPAGSTVLGNPAKKIADD